MESVPDLLYLKRRTWPRQIPPTEMRLAKGQVQEYAISLSQNPTHASAERTRRGSEVKRARKTVDDRTEELRQPLLCNHL